MRFEPSAGTQWRAAWGRSYMWGLQAAVPYGATSSPARSRSRSATGRVVMWRLFGRSCAQPGRGMRNEPEAQQAREACRERLGNQAGHPSPQAGAPDSGRHGEPRRRPRLSAAAADGGLLSLRRPRRRSGQPVNELPLNWHRPRRWRSPAASRSARSGGTPSLRGRCSCNRTDGLAAIEVVLVVGGGVGKAVVRPTHGAVADTDRRSGAVEPNALAGRLLSESHTATTSNCPELARTAVPFSGHRLAPAQDPTRALERCRGQAAEPVGVL